MNKKQSVIENAKKRFDSDLHTESYAKIHSDSEHLKALTNLVAVEESRHYLDVGTGNGYVAFELAQRFPEIRITGLDIAENAIKQNRSIRDERNLSNLEFISYQGIDVPLNDNSFFGIISRYAIHHFPDLSRSVKEFHRILESNGFAVISDPITCDNDTSGFVDRFQKLKKDGHVHFYREAELIEIFSKGGFRVANRFLSDVTYPREMSAEYRSLFSNTAQDILDSYRIRIVGDEVFITVKVLNIVFNKIG
ncbi:MAG: class I SAM-dependent methyltransferase [Proteobacteria bacterium]|nr:class I SAM-dependent methyltransferase [Pseudomonadota bacterium]